MRPVPCSLVRPLRYDKPEQLELTTPTLSALIPLDSDLAQRCNTAHLKSCTMYFLSGHSALKQLCAAWRGCESSFVRDGHET